LGTTKSSGGGVLSELDFLFNALLVVGAAVVATAAADLDLVGTGCGAGAGGGGEARRLVPAFGGLPTLFFAGAGAAAITSPSSSSSGTVAVFARFDPRVNRKSPSCSS